MILSIPVTEARQLYIKLAWIAQQGDDEDAFPEYNTSSIDLGNNVFSYQHTTPTNRLFLHIDKLTA